MPNRILRDWTDSETMDCLDVNEERFFTRLIMKVDDFGRYTSNVKMIKSSLFPLKTDVRETDIARWLTACEKAGLVALYNVAGKGYLLIENFKQVLRQKKEKYPPPKECLADDKQMISISQADASPERKGSRNENEVEVEPPPTDLRPVMLFQMFKRAAQGFDDNFLKNQVLKFLNKYPGCIAAQSGGLVNSWASNLNKQEQQKWRDQVKEEKPFSRLTVREILDQEAQNSIPS